MAFVILLLLIFWAINNPSSVPILSKYLPEPGILPDSKLYPVKLLYEDIRSFLTFDNLSKVKLYLELADKRLTEIKKLEEKGDISKAKDAIGEYQKLMEKSQETTQRVKQKSAEFEKTADELISGAKSKDKNELIELYTKASGEIKNTINDALEKIIKWKDEFGK